MKTIIIIMLLATNSVMASDTNAPPVTLTTNLLVGTWRNSGQGFYRKDIGLRSDGLGNLNGIPIKWSFNTNGNAHVVTTVSLPKRGKPSSFVFMPTIDPATVLVLGPDKTNYWKKISNSEPKDKGDRYPKNISPEVLELKRQMYMRKK